METEKHREKKIQKTTIDILRLPGEEDQDTNLFKKKKVCNKTFIEKEADFVN